MEKNKLVAALFDFDGVVMDTESQYTIFWGMIGRDYHPDIENFELKIKGSTLTQIYDRYFAGQIVLQAEITEQLNRFEKEMTYHYIPGFEQFVKELKTKGLKTAVVTSSNNEKMQNVYAVHPEMSDFFDQIITADMFNKSKPDPQCFLFGAKTLGATSDECIVFEDSFNGLKAGRAAEMFVVGLATTNSPKSLNGLADVIINDFRGITLDQLLAQKRDS